MKKIFLLILFLLMQDYAFAETRTSHGFAHNCDLKYKKGFKHFDYVNPDAPKGGTLKRASVGTFDSLNPFVLKGVSASGLGLIFESLCVQSEDEPFSMYGLIAKEITIPDSNKYVEFKLNENARFHDGIKITPQDVIFSFNILTTKGSPIYKKYYEDVKKVIKVSDDIVRFEFKSGDNLELPLIISQLSILPKLYYEKNGFEAGFTPPLGSGPYKIKSYKAGKYIKYQRLKNYWGRDLPVNKGMYNFDEITYDYYRDQVVALEAFKAKEFNFRVENVAKSWATRYSGPQFDNGDILKEEIPHKNSSGMQGFVFNLRKDIFKDKELRKALIYAFDFEWINKTLFYGQYKRSQSYFSNSELASSGLPGKEELKILEEFKGKIPDEVFTKEFVLPKSSGDGNNRKNLRKASAILKKAGYNIEGGKRVDKAGNKPIKLELLIHSPAFERIGLTYKKSLKRLGIDLEIRRVDDTQYYNRIRAFDYDMMVGLFPQSISPGNEQRYFFGSKSADLNGSRNYVGIKDGVIDELIEKLIRAKGRQSLINHVKALDRVLLWNHYVVPHFHINRHRIAHLKELKHPEKTPKYGFGLYSWWWEE